jgi:hypothetical protein
MLLISTLTPAVQAEAITSTISLPQHVRRLSVGFRLAGFSLAS